jgi:hypothetical protein
VAKIAGRHADRPRDILVGNPEADGCSQLCSQQRLRNLHIDLQEGRQGSVQPARAVLRDCSISLCRLSEYALIFYASGA